MAFELDKGKGKENTQEQKNLNAELRETAKSQAEIRQTLQEILFEQRNLADESRKFAKQLFGSASQATATARAFRGISNVTKEINSQIEGVIRGEIKFGDLQKSRNKLGYSFKEINKDYSFFTLIVKILK